MQCKKCLSACQNRLSALAKWTAMGHANMQSHLSGLFYNWSLQFRSQVDELYMWTGYGIQTVKKTKTKPKTFFLQDNKPKTAFLKRKAEPKSYFTNLTAPSSCSYWSYHVSIRITKPNEAKIDREECTHNSSTLSKK